jgi:prepilin-type N-terminal cleavage/methylation domain-containing protein
MLMTRARRLRTEESGFSLVELLVAMALSSIVLTAMLTLFIGGVNSSAKVSDRVEAAQRGRLTMDRVMTLLNSQSCLLFNDGSSAPPIISANATQVTFYASLGAVDSDPTKYQLRYDAASKSLFEDRYLPSRATGVLAFPATPNTSQVIGTGIVPTTAGAPIFSYYQFVDDTGPTLGMIDTTPLSTAGSGLSSADALNAVRVDVAFVAQTLRTASADPRSTSVEGTATVGSANPGEPTKGVNC